VVTLRTARPATIVTATTAFAVVVTMAGCTPGPLTGGAGAPISKPVALGSAAPSGSLEATRQRLEGTWDLVALESVPPAGGARVPVNAGGTLTYDQFGNLTIIAQSKDPNAPVAAREVATVSFKGRAVIDAASSELKLMDLKGNVDPNEVLAPERRRKFEFVDNMLKLSSYDAKGNVTAIATWQRRPS
jgi:hypothetical protein